MRDVDRMTGDWPAVAGTTGADGTLPRPGAGLNGNRKWVVVQTHAHREALARGNLERQGFEPYCPVIRKRLTGARGSKEMLRPLFPGYMFVALPAQSRWRPLLSTYGVRRVLLTGDAPSHLEADFVAALKAREIEGVIARPAAPYSVGQSISITDGPFEGLVARIVGLEDRDRVAVLLEMLGKPARAIFDTRSIAPR